METVLCEDQPHSDMSQGFYCCGKHHDQGILGMREFIWLILPHHCPSLKEVKTQKEPSGRSWCEGHGRLLTGLFSLLPQPPPLWLSFSDSSGRPGWLWTHRDLPASASQVLGLKACTIMPGYYEYLLHSMYPCGGSIGKRPQLPDKSLCQQWQLRTRVLPIYLLTAVDHSLCTHPCQHWTALCHKEQITSLSCGTESLKGGKPRIISHI